MKISTPYRRSTPRIYRNGLQNCIKNANKCLQGLYWDLEHFEDKPNTKLIIIEWNHWWNVIHNHKFNVIAIENRLFEIIGTFGVSKSNIIIIVYEYLIKYLGDCDSHTQKQVLLYPCTFLCSLPDVVVSGHVTHILQLLKNNEELKQLKIKVNDYLLDCDNFLFLNKLLSSFVTECLMLLDGIDELDIYSMWSWYVMRISSQSCNPFLHWLLKKIWDEYHSKKVKVWAGAANYKFYCRWINNENFVKKWNLKHVVFGLNSLPINNEKQQPIANNNAQYNHEWIKRYLSTKYHEFIDTSQCDSIFVNPHKYSGILNTDIKRWGLWTCDYWNWKLLNNFPVPTSLFVSWCVDSITNKTQLNMNESMCMMDYFGCGIEFGDINKYGTRFYSKYPQYGEWNSQRRLYAYSLWLLIRASYHPSSSTDFGMFGILLVILGHLRMNGMVKQLLKIVIRQMVLVNKKSKGISAGEFWRLFGYLLHTNDNEQIQWFKGIMSDQSINYYSKTQMECASPWIISLSRDSVFGVADETEYAICSNSPLKVDEVMSLWTSLPWDNPHWYCLKKWRMSNCHNNNQITHPPNPAFMYYAIHVNLSNFPNEYKLNNNNSNCNNNNLSDLQRLKRFYDSTVVCIEEKRDDDSNNIFFNTPFGMIEHAGSIICKLMINPTSIGRQIITNDFFKGYFHGLLFVEYLLTNSKIKQLLLPQIPFITELAGDVEWICCVLDVLLLQNMADNNGSNAGALNETKFSVYDTPLGRRIKAQHRLVTELIKINDTRIKQTQWHHKQLNFINKTHGTGYYRCTLNFNECKQFHLLLSEMEQAVCDIDCTTNPVSCELTGIIKLLETMYKLVKEWCNQQNYQTTKKKYILDTILINLSEIFFYKKSHDLIFLGNLVSGKLFPQKIHISQDFKSMDITGEGLRADDVSTRRVYDNHGNICTVSEFRFSLTQTGVFKQEAQLTGVMKQMRDNFGLGKMENHMTREYPLNNKQTRIAMNVIEMNINFYQYYKKLWDCDCAFARLQYRSALFS